ncbi:hypothetical protein CR51_11650 [Caballeronia megalochromosomata]|nr:hypothetical protein CR51_11650 [Caballeronia megalochromosomata]
MVMRASSSTLYVLPLFSNAQRRLGRPIYPGQEHGRNQRVRSKTRFDRNIIARILASRFVRPISLARWPTCGSLRRALHLVARNALRLFRFRLFYLGLSRFCFQAAMTGPQVRLLLGLPRTILA